MDDQDRIRFASLILPTSSGCVVVLISATISCLLLFLNGGFVMAFLNALADREWQPAKDPRITQFVVLLVPVLLLVVQWWMIDYLRTVFHRRAAVAKPPLTGHPTATSQLASPPQR